MPSGNAEARLARARRNLWASKNGLRQQQDMDGGLSRPVPKFDVAVAEFEAATLAELAGRVEALTTALHEARFVIEQAQDGDEFNGDDAMADIDSVINAGALTATEQQGGPDG